MLSRGVDVGFAVRSALMTVPAGGGPVRVSYGADPAQFGELYLPIAGQARGVAVVIHGGFWRQAYNLDLGRPLAADLAAAGIAAWNVEYRRVGGGGGWPETLVDVAAALDALADINVPGFCPGLDLARVVAVGHSAGGHLATWLATRPGLPPGAPGAAPRVQLRGVVSQAGVLDLVDAAHRRVGGSAVPDLLDGMPEEVPERYELSSPIARLPVGVPVVCVHGTADRNVPIRQSERYVAAARSAGDAVELRTLPGADHFAVIDASSREWATCREATLRLLA
jgi:acetyl esterase/lipase